MERKLAAILAADIVGYSRLTELDEEGTLAALHAHRALVDRLIATHHGRVFGSAGDSVVAEFPSVVEAIRCAVEIQQEFADRNATVPKDRRLEFRIGVNLGDVIVEGDNLYGNGVNVAARLESLAEPGGICVSRTVYSHVRKIVGLGFERLGEQRVKNIAEPIELYRVVADRAASLPSIRARWRARPPWRLSLAAAALIAVVTGGVSWTLYRDESAPPGADAVSTDAPPVQAAALPLPDRPSIAVLPFRNLSGDPERERLADGLTEDIITDLSYNRDLFVIAAHSTLAYKGKAVDVRQVGRELGVRYVLEGSLQTSADTVRITAQLIEAVSGSHLWSDRYDRPLDDLFAVQDEVTQTIVGTLGGYGTIVQAERTAARRKPPESLRAYDYYLLGIEHKLRFKRENVEEAMRLFKKAIAVDPTLARAHVGLGWVHLMQVFLGWSEDPQRSIQEARRSLRRAVALDPADAEAHVALAESFLADSDFERAASEYERAITLNPNGADILAFYGGNLPYLGRPEEGARLVDRAIRLNPNFPDFYAWYLWTAYYYTGRYEDALAGLLRRADPNTWLHLLAASYAMLGRPNEAAATRKNLLRLDPDFSGERDISDVGDFARDIERNRYFEGLRKAGLPVCATDEQLDRMPQMKRQPVCEEMRARS